VILRKGVVQVQSQTVYTKSWVLPSTVPAVGEICRQLLEQIRRLAFEERDAFAIHLALEEALTNAVHHGNHNDPEKTVAIDCVISPEKFDISITDQGSGFDPESLPDPRHGENLYKTEGRGVLLIRAYMDVVEYNTMGNCLHLIKYRGKTAPHKI
jgi:serine/threonine-protein kinase RsbW